MNSSHVLVVALFAGLAASTASATPIVNAAVIHTRVFNDAPSSAVTTSNLYPGLISISDTMAPPFSGFANRHNFHLSDNGGASDAVFLNSDAFRFESNVTITGNALSEGGLNISPWFSQQVDGVFAVIPANGGEIAAFGGRLPFYSFTNVHGLHYTLGSTVRMGVIYSPNGLSMASPGTIEYLYTDGSGTYSSGAIPFDQGNPLEDPPFGLWGILNDARVGGYYQPQVNGGPGQIVFGQMTFGVPSPSAVSLAAFATLTLLRRRR